MGQCGCGDFQPNKQYRVRGCTVALEIYPGCEDCQTPVGVVLHFFKPGSAFVADPLCDEIKVTPDEDGACLPGIELFDKDDLRAAAKQIGGEIGPGDDQYATIDDWLDEHGGQLLRDAYFHRLDEQKKNETPREG